ncbi:MAG: uracil-xanthine permease family protein [Candidatus Nanopelagicales bacterium]
MFSWTLHGDGRRVTPGEVVAPAERLSWPRTIGIGAQHIAAMFGATFLVPLLTGFPPTTTLLFSGIGTLLFVFITRNRIPSYLGSSFAFIAPVVAATKGGSMADALGGIVGVGVLLIIVGLIVQAAGAHWIEVFMPPVVTGTIVAVIGLNLAGVAKGGITAQPGIGMVTLATIFLISVISRGFLARVAIVAGLVVGYLFALTQNGVDTKGIADAAWFGLPSLTAPSFKFSAMLLFVPVVLVLIAENVGHVKAVATMTGQDLDGDMGRAIMADGIATTIAGFGGGSGTTTYAENIGVMAATRVYSTLAYMFAGVGAILLSLSPKLGAVLHSVPAGVLGGAGVALYGMIGLLGARIWIENRVNFSDPTNLFIAAACLVIGISDVTYTNGDYTFNGIVISTVLAVVGYQVMRAISRARGTSQV